MGRLYDAYVEVGPRFAGFGDIKKQGDRAGREYGKALAEAAVKAAQANVRRLGETLAKARSAEADAIGKVRIAEAKLNEVRADTKAKTSAIAAAEEQLAAAQRKSAAASDTAKTATEALGKAQKQAADAAENAAKLAGNKFTNAFRGAISKMGGDKEGKQFATRFGVGMNGAIGGIVSHSAGLFAAGFAAVKGTQVFGGFIKDAADSARVGRITEAVIKSTGAAAKLTAGQVGDLATAISNKTGADDETIQSGANMLLTFTNIRNAAGKNNDIFNQATQTVTDLAAAMNDGAVTQDGVKTASIQLGKALNDPIKGVTALQKVGVSFDDSQKKQIATLVKSGKTMQAQKIILKELNKEFGGAAAAAGDPFTRLTTIFGNLGEELGGYLLPYANKFANFISDKLIPGVSGLVSLLAKGDFTGGLAKAFGIEEDSGFVDFMLKVHDTAVTAFGYFKTEVLPRMKQFAGFLIGTVVPAVASLVTKMVTALAPAVKTVFGFFKSDVIPRLKEFAGFLGDKVLPPIGEFASKVLASKDFLLPFAGIILTVVGALKVWAIAQGILNVVMAANPVGLVVIAVAGLVAGLIYAYKHSEKFRTIVTAAFNGVKDAAVAVFNAGKAVVSGVVTAFTATKDAIGTAIGAVKKAFSTAFDAVTGAVGAVVNAVKTAFSTAVGFVRSVWSTIVSAVSGPVGAVLKILQGVWSRIEPILVLPFYIAKSVITTTFNGLRNIFSAAASWVGKTFAKAWAVVQPVLMAPIKGAHFVITTTWTGIRNLFLAGKNWVVGAFSKAWAAVKNILSGPIAAARSVLDTVWSGIKTAFNATKNFVTGAFAKGWAALKAIIIAPINGARTAISTILGAAKGGLRWVFSQAVSAISTIWNGLQALAKKPIRFIIDTVLNNGLIAGFNWIANKFGAPTIKPIPLPKGFAQGGKIPGRPSDVDNTFGFHNGGAIPLATGEFIVNARQTKKHLPLLEAINSGTGGYADGGLLGGLKNAVSNAYSKGKALVGDVADFTKDAAGWLKKKFSGPLNRLNELGDSAFAKIVTAVPRKIADTIVGKAKDLLKGIFGGGAGPDTPVGKVVQFRGELLNQRTIAMLLSAEAALRKTFHIMQGSYSTRVAASGSTHAGGGAMDTDNSGAGWDRAVQALRAVGFAAWHRTPSQGPWGDHIHSIAIGDPTASPAAKAQVQDFLRGGDGLGRARGGLIGSYASGAWQIPDDQLALLHKNEMVVPAQYAKVLRGWPTAAGRVRSRLHQLHEQHQAHEAHVAHVGHVNRDRHRFTNLARLGSRASVSADMGGGLVTRIHPDDLRDLLDAVKSSPLQISVQLDGRRVDAALSSSARNRGF